MLMWGIFRPASLMLVQVPSGSLPVPPPVQSTGPAGTNASVSVTPGHLRCSVEFPSFAMWMPACATCATNAARPSVFVWASTSNTLLPAGSPAPPSLECAQSPSYSAVPRAGKRPSGVKDALTRGRGDVLLGARPCPWTIDAFFDADRSSATCDSTASTVSAHSRSKLATRWRPLDSAYGATAAPPPRPKWARTPARSSSLSSQSQPSHDVTCARQGPERQKQHRRSAGLDIPRKCLARRRRI
mmetsp:Transcript_42798/g.121109  ORF Transcript_42798/g.121109 Transcript_42798/m.121109 type:complete len:243 (-) Transcript_42798:78-806(-)